MAGASRVSDDARKWFGKFFDENPGSTVRDAMKAANNAKPRIAPLWDLAKQVHTTHVTGKMANMLAHPTKTSPSGFPALVQPQQDNQEEVEEPMAQPKTPEETDITLAAKQLLAAMRKHGVQSCILTCIDDGHNPSAEWENEYRKKSSGKADL